uniref:Uncharacterized protein n=1 Tax=Rubinisphaera brasiliensis (strain ATCC 49424 / DSM 5305 / JCM 21570 / IAM 15109 / NBRC 103401 / IFAM 1448) TaxID=756272 RepID=F0SIU0_RUBBR|nr:hypothetical protein Plabr_3167 [Rubinisphaera brasiliensis DSM 5305]
MPERLRRLQAEFALCSQAQIRALLNGSVNYDFSTVEHVISINRDYP